MLLKNKQPQCRASFFISTQALGNYTLLGYRPAIKKKQYHLGIAFFLYIEHGKLLKLTI